MGYGPLVQVGQGIDDVLEELGCLPQTENSDLVLVLEECASVDVLEHKVEAVLHLKEAIELDNGRVVERTMQLDLRNELVHHVEFLQFLLHHLLNRHQKTSVHMLGQVHFSKFTLPQHPSELKPFDYGLGLSLRLASILHFAYGGLDAQVAEIVGRFSFLLIGCIYCCIFITCLLLTAASANIK